MTRSRLSGSIGREVETFLSFAGNLGLEDDLRNGREEWPETHEFNPIREVQETAENFLNLLCIDKNERPHMAIGTTAIDQEPTSEAAEEIRHFINSNI